MQGGKVLVLDEVHKYPSWSQEIKNLYDRYHDLKIIFTGSSIIDITHNEGDLSRRAVIYELHGLSFREFLSLSKGIHISEISLQEILNPNFDFRSRLLSFLYGKYTYLSPEIKTIGKVNCRSRHG